MAAQKWPLTPYIEYLNTDFSRDRCTTKTYEVPFSTYSGFADLIEWYSLYFVSVLTFKFKMAADAILKPIKSDSFCTKCAKKKKANEATFPTKFGIPDLMERIFVCSENHLDI